MREGMRRLGAVVLLFMLAFGEAGAQGWWEKGTDLLKSVTQGQGGSQELTLGEIGDAFREALRIGAANVSKQLGAVDGFNGDPAVHIPLPDELQTVKKWLGKVGMSSMVDDLELRLNRAAEAAAPKAKKLFWDSIRKMTFEDVKAIHKGPEDAATQYFKRTMSPALREEMRPVVDSSLAEVGAIKAYDGVIGKYRDIPFVPDVKADLTNHVLDGGLEGIFHYIAKEEAEIRRNPAKRTTELLKKVFGAK